MQLQIIDPLNRFQLCTSMHIIIEKCCTYRCEAKLKTSHASSQMLPPITHVDQKSTLGAAINVSNFLMSPFGAQTLVQKNPCSCPPP